MADKSVNLVGTKIMASTIADFYNRLNALRSLNGGTSTVGFSAPSYGSLVTPEVINQAKDAVLATKTALSFLATVNISTHTPVTPSTGELIEAKTTAHPIEWQIGQLENACFAYFGSNRVSNKSSNFSNFNLGDSDACGAFNTANRTANYTDNHGVVFATHRVNNHTANKVTQNTTHRGANNSNTFSSAHNNNRVTVRAPAVVTNTFGYSTNKTSEFASWHNINDSAVYYATCKGNYSDSCVWHFNFPDNRNNYFGANRMFFCNGKGGGTTNNGYWQDNSFGQYWMICFYFCTATNRGYMAAYHNTNYSGVNAPQFSAFFTGNYPTNHAAQRGVNYGTFFGQQFVPNFSPNFTAQYTSQFSTQRGTVHTTQFSTQCSPQCSGNNAAVKTSNRVSNNSADNTSDFTAFTASYYANHGNFTVSPL